MNSMTGDVAELMRFPFIVSLKFSSFAVSKRPRMNSSSVNDFTTLTPVMYSCRTVAISPMRVCMRVPIFFILRENLLMIAPMMGIIMIDITASFQWSQKM
ncbi:MAG: hypothetical protein BWY66_01654 [bacterium ADurb.Bin374]|nr:MAG: hypothetical protein BWY66_01654 [bacterium ADurb.Bin374]